MAACGHRSEREMALPPCDKAVVRKESLGDMLEVGSGGFGRVYKARHKDWGFDVAVKILKRDASHFMFQEANFMDLASCEFVLRVYGIYKGPSADRGLVMEYMRRGSIESLQKQLSGAPPWPLAFRLSHQTALAMNFLHCKNIVHLDLKPSNILLNDELNAKLADFGLCTVSKSSVGASRDSYTGPQGTFKYMPPEAFQLSYKPVRAFDIYSFGILLWSIFTGEEPYPGANYTRVELRIPEGDRPRCENLQILQVVGIKDIVALMEICWEENQNKRPHFKDILETTEKLFSRHSNDIRRAVDEVLTKLDSPNQAQQHNLKPVNEHTAALQNDVVDQVNRVSLKDDSSKTLTRKEKAKFVDQHRPALIQRVSHALAIAEELGNMVHSETYSTIRAKERPTDQVRVLYSETLRSGGERVKAAFYDALKKHQPFLMEELGD